jgi:hypothetical protein
MKINNVIRKQVNRKLYDLCQVKYDSIPMDTIQSILSESNLVMVQEDNTVWSGILCGDNESCYIDISDKGFNHVDNSVVCLQWYKFTSGRYEINCYIS